MRCVRVDPAADSRLSSRTVRSGNYTTSGMQRTACKDTACTPHSMHSTQHAQHTACTAHSMHSTQHAQHSKAHLSGMFSTASDILRMSHHSTIPSVETVIASVPVLDCSQARS